MFGKISFYLHGDGVFDFRNFSGASWDQYSIDQALVPQLYNHPRRSMDKSTKIHIVGLIPNALVDSRTTRMRAAAAAFLEVRAQHPHATFLVFSPHFDYVRGLGRALCQAISTCERCRLVNVDPDNARLSFNREFRSLAHKTVMIPYYVRPSLFSCAATRTATARSIATLFHGDTGRYDKGMRGAVRDIIRFVPNSSYVSTFRLRGNATALAAVYRQTERDLTRARMCFCPSGDTKTSGRLYESLAAGCVPIRIDSLREDELPFPKLIPWGNLTRTLNPKSMSLHQRHAPAPSSVMVYRKAEATRVKSWLADAKRLETMRIDGMSHACRYMNPANPLAFVDAILFHAQ